MDIIAWLVVGLVAGWLASRLVRSPHGIFVDLLLGVIGALVGGLISGQLLLATLGAVLLLLIHRRFFVRKRSRI
jgi:uncharacterized membrane protein YeaQ/YmgE (transglycosylase-associated protein family)